MSDQRQFALFPGIPPDELPLSQHDRMYECCQCGEEHSVDDSHTSNDGKRQLCEKCMECPNCGTFFALEDAYHHNGMLYCSDCVYTCEGCDTTTTDEDDLHSASHQGHRNRGTRCLCKDCAFQCADCSTWYDRDGDDCTYQNASNDRICSRCAENYSYCSSCNETIRSDDARYDDESGECYCNDCFPAADGKCIYSYGYKPTPIFQYAAEQLGSSNHLMLGWEIECDRKQQADSVRADVRHVGLDEHDVVYCKEDSSLDYGFEMVSHPGTWEFWKAFDFGFCPELADLGYRSYDIDTTGMHVHVSKAFLSEEDRYKLLLFFRTNHGLVIKLSRRLRHKLDEWAAIDVSRKPELLRKAKKVHECQKEREAKYAAINFQPTHTVEFRLFRGTLKVESIKRNLALVTAMCHFVKHTTHAKLADRDFLAYVREFGPAILGEPDATDLGDWVSTAVSDHCEPDLNH